MSTVSAVLLFVVIANASAMRDVPKGECYDCEVTCFEDCALKYDREIIQMDFLQVPEQKNRTASLTDQYGECLQEEKCPCKAATAASAAQSKTLALVDKKKGKCAAGAMPCSSKCADKIVDKDIASLTKEAEPKGKAFIQKKAFPLHAVKINAFAKGKMTLDHCLKYCLAATCGCEDAPGFEVVDKTVAANAAVNAVTDTPKSGQYRPAKIEECGKGMMGKKVASGLFVKLVGGPGGMFEVCSADFLGKVGAPGDAAAKCKSGALEDVNYGCLWSSEKSKCIVGFSPILVCNVEYHNDPTL